MIDFDYPINITNLLKSLFRDGCGEFQSVDIAKNAVDFLIEHIQVQYLMWIFQLEFVHFLPISLNSFKNFSGFIISFVELLQNDQFFLL